MLFHAENNVDILPLVPKAIGALFRKQWVSWKWCRKRFSSKFCATNSNTSKAKRMIYRIHTQGTIAQSPLPMFYGTTAAPTKQQTCIVLMHNVEEH